jgi:hypothetical protein
MFVEWFDKYFAKTPITRLFWVRFYFEDGSFKDYNLQKMYETLRTIFVKKEFLYGFDNSLVPCSSDGPPNFILKSLQKLEFLESDIEITRNTPTKVKRAHMKPMKNYKDRGGKFFDHLLKEEFHQHIHLLYVLKSLQIFDKIDFWSKQKLVDNCFIYALNQTSIDPKVIDAMKYDISRRYIPITKLTEIAEKYNLNLRIRNLDRDAKTNQARMINLGEGGTELPIINCFRKHYFIDYRTEITSYYIENLATLSSNDYNIREKYKGKLAVNVDPEHFLTTGKLIEKMFNLGYFRPITYPEAALVSEYTKPVLDENTSLEFNPKYCCRKIVSKESKNTFVNNPIYYADFEASSVENPHIPYMCSVSDKNGDTRTFIGRNCATQLLEFLPDGAVLYFHNLMYNFSFLVCHGVCHMIKKGNRNMYS